MEQIDFDHPTLNDIMDTIEELNDIYYKAILYIYTEDRKLIIVTPTNKYTINMAMKDIIPMLDSRFKQCYRSCIINTERVCEKNYKEGYFITDTGKKVYMLSKKYKKDLEV